MIGFYSVVYKVHNNIYAWKKVNLQKLKDKERQNALNEVWIFASVKSLFVISYKEVFIGESPNTIFYLSVKDTLVFIWLSQIDDMAELKKFWNISPNSIGVIVNKQVKNRIVEKRIHARVAHLRISTCNANFKQYVKALEKAKNDNPNIKQKIKRLSTGSAEKQKIVVNKDSVIKFYNHDC